MGIQGENRVLSFSFIGIKDKFALNGENLTEEYMEILFGSIFNPTLIDGGFDPEILEIEKEKLKEILLSEINDKRGYCLKQARRKFFEGNLAGVEKYGYIEEIDDITPQQVYTVYQDVLKRSLVEVMVLGADQTVITDRLVKEFNAIDRCPAQPNIAKPMPTIKTQEFTQPVDAVQGKLAMVFTTNEKLASEDLSKMRMAIALLGGLSSSRLFLNVREKQNLCYYCASAYIDVTGVLTIDSGVEHENAEKTKNAILTEIESLITGEITDDEMADTKRAIQTGLTAVGDSMGGIESWYFGEISRKTSFEPIQVIEQLNHVTKQDIKDMLKKFTLSVVYTLTKAQ